MMEDSLGFRDNTQSSRYKYNDSLYYNTTVNTSMGIEEHMEMDAMRAEMIPVVTAAHYLLLVLGLLGNGSLIKLIFTHRSMRRHAMNHYILNIAIADFIQNAVALIDVTQFLMDRGWLLGDALCRVERYTLVVCIYVSIISLTVVAFERFGAVVYPIKAHAILSLRRVRQVIILTWIVAATCASPVAIFNRVVSYNNADNGHCQQRFSDNFNIHFQRKLIYKYTEFTFFFALPLIIQLVLYIIIVKRLNQRQHTPLSERTRHESSHEQPEMAAEEMKRSRRSRIQAVRMLATCVIVYFISYLPIQILLFYETATRSQFNETWLTLVTVITLVYINSAANPVIYYACNKTYRSKLDNMWRCRGTCVAWRRRARTDRFTLNSLRSSGQSGSKATNSVRTTSIH